MSGETHNPLHLSANEKIEHEIKRHWIAILPASIGSLLLAALPWGVFWVVVAQVGTASIDPWIPLLFGLYTLWILIVWSFFFMTLTDYALDRWYITNERLIDVDQQGLFNRRISSLELSDIEDVTTDIGGVIATFLNFGKLRVQSAGTSREFELKTASKPQNARKRIAHAVDGEDSV